ncbi:F-box only protein 43-like [Salvelinus fontinalis]|uniref:F-box only protein 43-like n=1 Tax=Salvelinus fontinalis TaxID=8038 RepID=UPI0024852085|nr:F-box only protein 43-like [Salvelinus fontinalis]XP_055780694.1 F-box only protein 43-like [Salvelinus fontinalis]
MDHCLGPDVNFHSLKDLQYGACHDSGYLDSGYSSKIESGDDFNLSKCFSSDGLHETPKENVSQKCEPLSPRKNRQKESVRSPLKDILKEQPLQNGWCETPKVSRKDPLLRRRLLMSKSAPEGKTADDTETPCTKRTDSSANGRTEHGSNGVFDSPDAFTVGALATSTLKPEDVLLSGRKLRLLFSLVKTSTLEDGKCNTNNGALFERKSSDTSLSDADLEESIVPSDLLTTEMLETPRYSRVTPSVKDHFQTPIDNDVAANLSDSPSVLSTPTPKHHFDTPSSTPTHKHYDRFVSDDSGFSSLALDKSQDSTVDNDGSFQELLLLSSGSSRCKETPSRLAEMKRRSRLERQRRLSTLREGGSQSEGDRDVRNLAAHRTHGREKNLISQGHLERSIIDEDDDSDVFPDVTPPKTTTAKLEDLSFTPALQMVQALSQRTSRMLLEHTSLEELLRVSEKEAFRTTMPLAGLIGRKMGLGKVDIFTELKKKNLRHILAKILNQLSSEDVYRVGQVSRSWNEVIVQDKVSSRRRRHYLMDVKAALELGSAVHVPDAETRLTLLSRSALKSVQAQSGTPRTSVRGTPQSGTGTVTPVQHNSASKQDLFIQVAKTLFVDECLKSCPRCRHPARCHSVKMEGVCSGVDCGFRFCTACLCTFHGSRECASLSAKRRGGKDVLPGSARSKRNVRRL